MVTRTYHWRTDSASGEIEADGAENAADKLIDEGEWFLGAENDGGWLTIFENGIPVLRYGQMP